MHYTKSYFEDVVSEYGEVFFVLDSGSEYEVHGTDQYEFVDVESTSIVHIEGMRDSEYYKVDFPLGAIEHHYTHREV
jgi:hypothetical protein